MGRLVLFLMVQIILSNYFFLNTMFHRFFAQKEYVFIFAMGSVVVQWLAHAHGYMVLGSNTPAD